MKDSKDMHIDVKLENVAVPEVQVVGFEEAKAEMVENDKIEIDFSGAIPEIHIGK